MRFTELRQYLGRFQFSLIAIAVVVLATWLGYKIGNARLGFLEQERQRLDARVERMQTLNEQLEYQLNILRVERDVDRVAITNLQNELRQMYEQSADIRRELAFFQRVMAPELDADGVTIDSLAVWPTNDEAFHFRLILLQLDRVEPNLTTGSYRITVHGRTLGEPTEHDLLDLAGIEHENGERSFAMNYFSRLDGAFVLPEGFEPEWVQVQVRVRAGRQTTQQFTWGELTSTVEQPFLLDAEHHETN